MSNSKRNHGKRKRANLQQELDSIFSRLEREMRRLELQLEHTEDQNERILIKAELRHFERAFADLKRPRRRKPPESGLPVPAVPPNGPLPKQGGAEAPLEFD